MATKPMDHEELARRLEARLDKIEEKLDKHILLATENEVDLRWVKGSIKLALSAIITLTIGLATTIFNTFFSK